MACCCSLHLSDPGKPRTQEPPSEFLPAEPGIRPGASWRTTSGPRPRSPQAGTGSQRTPKTSQTTSRNQSLARRDRTTQQCPRARPVIKSATVWMINRHPQSCLRMYQARPSILLSCDGGIGPCHTLQEDHVMSRGSIIPPLPAAIHRAVPVALVSLSMAAGWGLAAPAAIAHASPVSRSPAPLRRLTRESHE